MDSPTLWKARTGTPPALMVAAVRAAILESAAVERLNRCQGRITLLPRRDAILVQDWLICRQRSHE